MGAAYVEHTRIHRKQNTPRFIDKMPNNFVHVGLIRLILPRSRIIDVRDYVDLMTHFDAVLPGSGHRIFYEDLIQNPEVEIRRLLDYCGLSFESACLTFHQTRRPVRTVSSEQVRRPLYRDALARPPEISPRTRPRPMA